MALLLSNECLVMNASNSLIFIRFDVFAVVTVAQLVKRPDFWSLEEVPWSRLTVWFVVAV